MARMLVEAGADIKAEDKVRAGRVTVEGRGRGLARGGEGEG